jgi:hypothetical protein
MEVIKSVIREASGHSADLRCGLEGVGGEGEEVTDSQGNVYCPVTIGRLDIKPWIKFTCIRVVKLNK